MEIIQSFWTRSFGHSHCGIDTSGWPAEKFKYISVALSCLLLHKNAGPVTLITDEPGKRLLIDEMNLPYASYSTNLNKLTAHSRYLTITGKLYALGIPVKPFLHIDNSVYTGAPPFVLPGNAALITATKYEVTEPYFQYVIKFICTQFNDPEFNFREPDYAAFNLYDLNIIGGQDLPLIKAFSTYTLAFINKYSKLLSRYIYSIPVAGQNLTNHIIEQFLFYQFIKKNYNQPATLSNYSLQKTGDYTIYQLPNNGLISALAFQKKQNITIAETLEFILRTEFPEYYYRIIHLVNHKMLTC